MATPTSTEQPTLLVAGYRRFIRPLLLRLFAWLHRTTLRHAGGKDRPVFYDIDATCPALRVLEQNFDVIQEELQGVLATRESLPRYHDLDQVQDEISGNSGEKWRVFMLDVVGQKPSDSRRLCPRTLALLERIPYVNQAFFSILEPRKSVPAHEGPYCGYLRYHLGMVVPKERPPHIRLHDQTYVWKEREGVLFDDSWDHEVVNHSDSIRVVLLVDVLRPLPWAIHWLNVMWTRGVGRFYSNKVLGKLDAHKLGFNQ
jgi:aspartyl/asparaginyl beta-hydroxylase (cupin superfamily)